MDILGKIFALITSIIFTFSGGGPIIADYDATPSTKLTQTDMIAGELPYELQLKDFYANSEEAFVIPGLKEGFVPQGIFYEEKNDIFLLSGYYKNKAQTSRVIVVDGDGTFIKSVGCQGKKSKATGHFGGIAVYKDNVYVVSTSVTHVLSLSKILAADDDTYVPIEAELYTDTTCSYVNVCDGVLYIGEFTDITIDDVKSATNVYKDKWGKKYYSRCNAFILDENAQWGIKADKIDADNNMVPDFAFTSPFKIQGMARLADGKIVYTASSTAVTNSRVYLYEDVTADSPDEIIKVAGQDVPLYYCQKKDRIAQYRVPTYLEEITVYPDGTVYIITESAAAPYVQQSKNPIDYVIKWDINNMK